MSPRTLKSAMKVPGTPARKLDNPLSPTFREEDLLEKREARTDKEQARDLVSFQFPSLSETSKDDGLNTGYACRESRRESAWPSSPSAA